MTHLCEAIPPSDNSGNGHLHLHSMILNPDYFSAVSAKCVLESARGEGGSKKAEKLRAYLMYGP